MSTITCPSSMRGELRGMTGVDGRYLANPSNSDETKTQEYLISHCWTETVDAGVYTLDSSGRFNWDNLLVGDQTFLLLAIRARTFPDEPYAFKCKCEDCGKRFVWEVDIDELLDEKTQPLSEESAEAFRNGNRFESTITVSKKPVKITFKLPTIAEQKRAQLRAKTQAEMPKKKREELNPLVDQVLDVLLEVEGVATDRKSRHAWLEAQSMGVLQSIQGEIARFDCGVDKEIEIECPHCSAEQNIDLPFVKAFFLPESDGKKAKRAATKARATDDDEANAEA